MNNPTRPEGRTYTLPDVLEKGVTEGWADPETDPTQIDWTPRIARAAIQFDVVDGRPLNPFRDQYPTGVRYGRNEMGHWGEATAADALVLVRTPDGARHALMIERKDKHGIAIPGGKIDPGELHWDAATRELMEETCLMVQPELWTVHRARYVPDPRASDEAWMVTFLCVADLPVFHWGETLPAVTGATDAKRAMWLRADTYEALVDHIAFLGGTVFPAHVEMLREALAPLPGN